MALNYLVDPNGFRIRSIDRTQERPARDESTQTKRRHPSYPSRRPTKSTTLTNSGFQFRTHSSDRNKKHIIPTYALSGRNHISNEGWGKKKKKEDDEKINVEYRSGQDIRSGDPNHVTRRERLQSNDEYNYLFISKGEQLISKPSTTTNNESTSKGANTSRVSKVVAAVIAVKVAEIT